MVNTDTSSTDETPSPAGLPSVSVGIFAHNEEATVSAVLNGFLQQRITSVAIDKIIVVCCGCTDRTVPLVRRIAREHVRVELIVRQKREGKIAAVNTFLMATASDVLVLASSDVIPAQDLVERLASPLIADESYAMTGPRVVAWPSPAPWRVVDKLHDALWSLHHAVSLRSPKLGEIVAVRRTAAPNALPGGVHCDEALLESLVVEKGGKLGYVSSALAYNFPPENLSDFYLQRRRIVAQHVLLKRTHGYRPSTTQPRYVIDALRRTVSASPSMRSYLVLLCLLESIVWLHGRWDVLRGRDYQLWRVTRHGSTPDDRPVKRAWFGTSAFGTASCRRRHDRDPGHDRGLASDIAAAPRQDSGLRNKKTEPRRAGIGAAR
jgi:glycosyltransferase involved in cell wall biosynthesis